MPCLPSRQLSHVYPAFLRLRGRHDEIHQRYVDEITRPESVLEAILCDDRRKTIAGLVRYYRLRRKLPGLGTRTAADLSSKRAVIGCRRPAFPRNVGSLIPSGLRYDSGGRFQLLLLIGCLCEHREGNGESRRLVVYAADIARTHLNDRETAARLLARVLNAVPDHAYALRRAHELFARGRPLR